MPARIRLAWPGSARTCWGSLSAPRPLSRNEGPNSKGGWRGKERVKEGGRRGKGDRRARFVFTGLTVVYTPALVQGELSL